MFIVVLKVRNTKKKKSKYDFWIKLLIFFGFQHLSEYAVLPLLGGDGPHPRPVAHYYEPWHDPRLIWPSPEVVLNFGIDPTFDLQTSSRQPLCFVLWKGSFLVRSSIFSLVGTFPSREPRNFEAILHNYGTTITRRDFGENFPQIELEQPQDMSKCLSIMEYIDRIYEKSS